MNVLLTGGAGYIGSHIAVELLARGDRVVIVDDLSNSSEKAVEHIRMITGAEAAFYRCDIRDKAGLNAVFSAESIDCCVHLAGKKAVGESVEKPLMYYDNNIGGTVTLLEAMRGHGVKKLVFSSSATVYGEPETMPMNEKCPRGRITNPYGRTKAMIEEILEDLYRADPEWSITILRYFNPVGAHSSGLIGEDPHGTPNNLMPYITKVAAGKLPRLTVFGDDYDTPDGTGVRDYIHVVDLARGHTAALDRLDGLRIYNLGTGHGSSVLELVGAFERATGVVIPRVTGPRRAGDVAVSYADPALAQEELGWHAVYSLEDMCRDAWSWQTRFPDGYAAEKQ